MRRALAALAALGIAIPAAVRADTPAYLRDRGEGIPTSLFGTYVRSHEWLVYPFYEYTLNSDQEYKPSELGFDGEHDYRGKLTEQEALIFASYGFSDWIDAELESAIYTTATQHKAANDPSALPDELTQSGFGDTQAELRFRLHRETERRPELFGYFETVFPFQHDQVLIGTQEWEFILGLGLIKGFGWGTVLGRASAVYVPGSDVEVDELSVEYLKRLAPSWRAVLAVEGEQDEWALIAEAQWFVRPDVFVKLNNGFGLTSKAPDLAPELGVVFSF